jgi:hypothetical protein
MVRRLRPAVIALLGLAFAMTAGETKGDEFYYVIIFGSQSKPKLLQYTHTWATVTVHSGLDGVVHNGVRAH